jgi:hypothetical protein
VGCVFICKFFICLFMSLHQINCRNQLVPNCSLKIGGFNCDMTYKNYDRVICLPSFKPWLKLSPTKTKFASLNFSVSVDFVEIASIYLYFLSKSEFFPNTSLVLQILLVQIIFSFGLHLYKTVCLMSDPDPVWKYIYNRLKKRCLPYYQNQQ